MANLWAWLKRGFTAENTAAITITLLATLGGPALVRWIGGPSVSWLSLVVMGMGIALAALGLHLIRVARHMSPSAVRAVVDESLSKFKTGPSYPMGARHVGDWYVFHEGAGPLPFRAVRLELGIGRSGLSERRIVGEVSDPDFATDVHRAWQDGIAIEHLPPKTDVSWVYPEGVPPHGIARFVKDGEYVVRWWAIQEDGSRRELAEEAFTVRDGILVQDET